MKGCWVFVCGASGAGKDSVMRWAEIHLSGQSRIVFSRRWITRPASPGSDHDEMTVAQFKEAAESDNLAWQWQAHDFDYGIDASYAPQVAAGQVVVVNGSREHAQLLERNASVRVVHIEVSPDVLEARLTSRGREAPAKIAERLARNQLFPNAVVHHQIVNEGELATAGKALADYLMLCCAK